MRTRLVEPKYENPVTALTYCNMKHRGFKNALKEATVPQLEAALYRLDMSQDRYPKETRKRLLAARLAELQKEAGG